MVESFSLGRHRSEHCWALHQFSMVLGQQPFPCSDSKGQKYPQLFLIHLFLERTRWSSFLHYSKGVFLVLWGRAGEDESIWGKQVLPVVCWGVWYNFCSTGACGLQSPAADTEDTLLPPYMNSHLYMKILDCVLVLFLQYLYPPAMLCLCKMVNLPLLWWCYSHFTSSKPLKLFSS